MSAQDGLREIGILPDAVRESSGLLLVEGRLLTHNDSGDGPYLYELDTVDLQIVRRIFLEGALHVDWEDIAQDAEYIYVGDFGNNRGDRRDLAVYKFAKEEMGRRDTVGVETIPFRYADQVDFNPSDTHDFDAEAMIARGDSLVVFTKERGGMGTTAYRLPKQTQSVHEAHPSGFFDVSGLVTGAAYDGTSGRIALVGYSSILLPFLVEALPGQSMAPFSDGAVKSGLGTGLAQVEAITTQDGYRYFISSEQFENESPPITSASRVWTFTWGDPPDANGPDPSDGDGAGNPSEDDPADSDTPMDPGGDDGEGNGAEGGLGPPGWDGQGIFLYQAAGSDRLVYFLESSSPVLARAIFDSTGRMLRYTPLESLENQEIDTAGFPPALYYLAFFLTDRIMVEPFLKR